MSVYRVTMKINFLVEINDENAMADPRPSLQSDTSQAALNRASWIWLRGQQMVKELSKSLGVRRSFAMKKDWEVVRLEDGTLSHSNWVTPSARGVPPIIVLDKDDVEEAGSVKLDI